MKSQKSQAGSAHLAIIIVLVIALIGTLGFVFWQNFANKKAVDSTAQTSSSDTKTEETTTDGLSHFKNLKYDVLFDYPSDWTVEESESNDESLGTKSYAAIIKNAAGVTVGTLGADDGGGLGGTCDDDGMVTMDVLDSVALDIMTDKPVSFIYAVNPTNNGSNKYTARYGLSVYNKEIGPHKVCPNTIYLFGNPTTLGGNKFGLLSFGNGFNGQEFNSRAEAEAFVGTGDYKKFKAIVVSFDFKQ